jgi:hypothetical protein
MVGTHKTAVLVLPLETEISRGADKMPVLGWLVLILTAALAAATAVKADERDVVAHTFHTNGDYLIMNLPPRPDTWPGAIFTANLRVPIKHGDPKDPALHRGQPVGISSNDGFDIAAAGKSNIANWFGVSAGAGDVADVVLYFPDARVVDMDLNDLLHHVETSPEVIDAVKRGQIPLVVIKAYLGTPTVTITKKASASAEAWVKVQANAKANASASSSSKNTITYKSSDDLVFAFETAQIQLDPTDLGKGKYTITIASLPQQLYAVREDYADTRLVETVSATTGISVSAIKEHGILGGAASIVNKPFGCILGKC